MNTNTDKLGREQTNTARIPRPALKPVPRVLTPTVPSTATSKINDTSSTVNPLKSMTKKEKSTDTVQLKVVKDARPSPSSTHTVKLRPPNAAPSGHIIPPKPATTATESISKSSIVAAAERTQKMRTPAVVATKTVKLKSPIKPGNMTAIKPKSASSQDKTIKMHTSPQDKTVKMRAIPDAATGAEKTSIAPPMPFEDDAQDPGALMTILNLASVAAVCAGLYFTFQSMTDLGML